MKCISCGNLISDSATVCPYCNNQQVQSVPENINATQMAVNQTSVIPETPTQPVLPQDQGMTMTMQMPTVPTNNIDMGIGQMQTMEQPQVNLTMAQGSLEQVPQPEMVAPVSSMDQVNPMGQVGMVSPMQNQIPPVQPMGTQPDVIDGSKIASTGGGKKKGGFGKIIIGLVVLIILTVAAGGGYFYYSQYKTGSKRIDTIMNIAFRNLNTLKNENVEKASGKYTLEGSFESGEEKITAKANGTYAYDLPNGMMDYTVNVESLTMGEELFDKGPLNLELYVNDSKAYVLLKDFYDKYIYTDVEGLEETFETLEQNDINYQTIVFALRDAFKTALKASSYTQTVGDVKINGKTQKANVITIKFTEDVQKRITTTFVNSLANNANFIKEVATISQEDETKLKEELLKILDEMKYNPDYDGTLKICTAMFGETLIGITFTEKDEDDINSLEFFPSNGGYGLVAYENDKKLLECEYVATMKNTAETRESTTGLKLTVYQEDTGAVKLDVNVGVIQDVNPKVESVNVKNSINAQYLTSNDIISIYDKAIKHGNFGVVISEMFGEYIEELKNPTPQIPADDSIVTNNENAVLNAQDGVNSEF